MKERFPRRPHQFKKTRNRKTLPPRILIVDDEKNIRKTLGLVFEGEGYEVTSVGSAEGGLKHLESDGADLMILDVKLPGMNDIDMLRKIRGGNKDTSEIPIIMMSIENSSWFFGSVR